jgi:hypothetical protein
MDQEFTFYEDPPPPEFHVGDVVQVFTPDGLTKVRVIAVDPSDEVDEDGVPYDRMVQFEPAD